MKLNERLLILDSNSILHRAFHALPSLTTKKGEQVSAVYGFLLVFFKALREIQPDFVCACFDFPAKTFRHKKFIEYKATRPPTPKDLASQIEKTKEILNFLATPVLEKEGFEADDLIGTLVKKFPEKEKIILTGDSDTLQLINKNTEVYLLKKGVKNTVLYGENLVKERYEGLKPEQIPDFKALIGDISDNIPGVPGVGEKTAFKILQKFDSLENLYQELGKNLGRIKELKPELKNDLIKYKKQVFLSKFLVKIKKDVSLDFNLKKSRWGNYDKKKVTQVLNNFEFYSLIKRLEELEIKRSENIQSKQKTLL